MKKTVLCVLAGLVIVSVGLAVYFGLRPDAQPTPPETVPPTETASPGISTPSPESLPVPSVELTKPETDGQRPTPTSTISPEDLSSLPSEPPQPSDEGNEVAREQVLLSPPDHIYHRPACQLAKDSFPQASRKDAVAQGYAACKICRP